MKRLLPLVIVICAAIGCTPKHNLKIRLKGFHNDTLILGVMPLSDYIANNYDNFNCLVEQLPNHSLGIKGMFPLWALTGLKFLKPELIQLL